MKARILIIDDEPSIVQYLSAVLEDSGYETVGASNGQEGLEEVQKARPDLVCLDITMPEKSGLRFYRELREDPDNEGVKVVVVTAVTTYEGDPEPFRRFLDTRTEFRPPDAFVTKPIEPASFVQTIESVLAGAVPHPEA